MKTQTFRSIAVALLVMFFTQTTWATCGGGGGGGGGGMSGGGGGSAPVYNVPWKIFKVAEAPKQGLVLYWFPASQKEWQSSSLKESRTLSLYASQCVSMSVADPQIPSADKLIGDSKLPVAVLAKPDGSPIGKVENTNGKLKVADVEKLLDGEMKQRETALEGQMKEAAGKAKAGDKDGAISVYKAVLDQKFQRRRKRRRSN